jgi:rhodanese-related sulfurtransferase
MYELLELRQRSLNLVRRLTVSFARTMAVALAGGAILFACGRATKDQASAATQHAAYTDITPQQLHDMMQAKDFVLVNVHIPYMGDIAGTDLSIPFDQIAEQVGKLPADKNAKIVLYCRSGRMSIEAAGTLAAIGYTHLYNLAGGMNAWTAASYSLEVQ